MQGFNRKKDTPKIIYVSSMVPSMIFKELYKKSTKIPGQQIQVFHRLIFNGFMLNDVTVNAISSLPVTRVYTTRFFIFKKSIKENGAHYFFAPTINLGPIRFILNTIYAFFKTISLSIFRKNTIVICDPLNVSISSGAYIAARLCRIKIAAILTDLPEFLWKGLKVKFNNSLIKKMDYYIFLTDYMNEKINTKSKPFIVIEGVVDYNMKHIKNDLNKKYNKKIVMYAGKLEQNYGIIDLIKSFILAKIPNAELHIYGDGECVGEVNMYSSTNQSIKYFGSVPNDIIVSEELKVLLLVNPRKLNLEFTKYSFPSKNLEYMVSGTPLLTKVLPGIPNEYFKYTYNINSDDVIDMSKKLIEILNISHEDLHKKGDEAKRFVIKNKNNVVQSKKLIKFLFENIKK